MKDNVKYNVEYIPNIVAFELSIIPKTFISFK